MKKIRGVFSQFTKILILSILILSSTITSFASTELDGKRINVKAERGAARTLLKLNGKSLPTSYVFTLYNGKELPAYCVNEDRKGVGDIPIYDYDVNVKEITKDKRVHNVLLNGYPYRTPEELGVKDKYEAFNATKHAIYATIAGRNKNMYSPVDSEGGRRTYKAFCDILDKAQRNENIYKQGFVKIENITNWNVNGIYLEKILKTTSSNIGKGNVIINSQNKDIKVFNKKGELKSIFNIGEEFKLQVPIKSLNGQKYKITVHAELDTKPVLYAESTISGTQNYVIGGIMIESDIKAVKEETLPNNTTKILINKIDGETGEPLKGVEFAIQYNNKTTRYTTNKDGEIKIENALPGKYVIKEIKPLEGYANFNENINLNIDFKENVKIKVKNNKIQVNEKEESYQNFEIEAKGNVSKKLVIDKKKKDTNIINFKEYKEKKEQKTTKRLYTKLPKTGF